PGLPPPRPGLLSDPAGQGATPPPPGPAGAPRRPTTPWSDDAHLDPRRPHPGRPRPQLVRDRGLRPRPAAHPDRPRGAAGADRAQPADPGARHPALLLHG